jgi:hypothetical protein
MYTQMGTPLYPNGTPYTQMVHPIPKYLYQMGTLYPNGTPYTQMGTPNYQP